MVTQANQWKGRQGTELELPSGNVALVRKPGIQHFLKTGKIPNGLKSMIQKTMKEGGGKKDVRIDALFEDESQLVELFELMDKILVEVVIEPKVLPVPLDETGEPLPLGNRSQDSIYVDEVELDDKAFIFQFAMGGTRELESFRQEQGDALAGVSAVEGVDDSPEPTPGS